MISCKNRTNGCGKWFESPYGLRVHLRSCMHGTRDIQECYLRDDGVEVLPSGYNQQKYEVAEVVEWNGSSSLRNVLSTGHDVLDIQQRSLIAPPYEAGDDDKEDDQLIKLLMLKFERLGRRTAKREVNSIIDILRDSSFNMNKFQLRCGNYGDCIREQELQTQRSFGLQGFRKQEIIDTESQFRCNIYTKSPIAVLQEQIAGASGGSTIFNVEDSQGHMPYSHPMTSDLGVSAVPAVRMEIMAHGGKNVVWQDGRTSLEKSFVGLVQLYSDKSQNSLKASTFQFYPLHITLLNFSEEHRRRCIVGGKTFLAFLPVDFFHYRDDEESDIGHRTFGRKERLRLLHLAINLVLKDLEGVAFSGFSSRDHDGISRRCHPCVASYCCDMPESKDLSSVRNGNQGNRNCHRCLAETDKFNTYTTARMRTGRETTSIITRATEMRKNGSRASSEALLKDYSLTEQLPILHGFPFMKIHPSLDFHAIFMVEILHEFHLGLSKELKRCAAERLRSENILTNSLPTRTNIRRTVTLKQVRMTILNGVNTMLAHIQETSPSNGLRIDLSRNYKGEQGNGLYNSKGNLTGMLEAKDYRSLDMVSPFIGMFLDRCSDEVNEAPTTSLFVQYVELMQMALSYDNCTSWTEERIKLMERRIKIFKSDARMMYQKYHPSGLRTEKLHMLDHVPFDLRRAGGLQYGDAGLYEYSHTLVKRAYRCGSKRKANAMDETLEIFEREMNQEKLEQLCEADQRTQKMLTTAKVNKCSLQAMENDCAGLVGTGKTILFSEFKRSRVYFRKLRKCRERLDENESKKLRALIQSTGSNSKDLAKDIGEDGSRVLCSQLVEVMNRSKRDNHQSSDYSVTRIASCYVPGIETPTLRDYNAEKNEIKLRSSSFRELQRIISERNFQGVPGLRQDYILIQGQNDKRTGDTILWVGKALALLRLRDVNAKDDNDRPSDDEYVFVQYMDAVPPRDVIDKKLKCIRLQWARDDTDTNINREPTKWFDLLPISTIRGRVHVIRGDYGVDGISATKDAENVPWYDQFFYINRFYYDTVHRYSTYKIH